MPPDLCRHFQRMNNTSEWASDVRTVATSDGIVTIAPNWMAEALISSPILFRRADTSAKSAYVAL
ncbi:hypothetical protein AEGHOMDF_1660 [Methylobacterium soli]|nr:hypothetical protein AEGHOMDF_1660 [Methylobacterium soli]